MNFPSCQANEHLFPDIKPETKSEFQTELHPFPCYHFDLFTTKIWGHKWSCARSLIWSLALFTFLLAWHTKPNLEAKSMQDFPLPQICHTKTQDITLVSERTMLDSWKTTHVGFLLYLQLGKANKKWLKMPFPEVYTLWTNYHTGNRPRSSDLADVLNPIQINHWRVALKVP